MKPSQWESSRQALVIAPNWVGDAMMALPALRALEAALPETRMLLLARPAPAAALSAAGLRSPALSWPSPRGPAELLSEFRHLRRTAARIGNLDFILLLPNSFHSALQACALGARARIGYRRDARGWLLTHPLSRPRRGGIPAHESYYYLELLRLAGFIARLPESVFAQISADENLCALWRSRLQLSKSVRLVVVHAGAAYGEAKRWPPECFVRLLAALPSNCRVALVGSAAERPLAIWIETQLAARAASPSAPSRFLNLAGETGIADLIAVLSLADVVVANDSGPMHLAAALGRPLVALFGPTNDRETYPLGPPGWRGLRLLCAEGVSCRPCKLRQCPVDHRCMRRLDVNIVLAAVQAWL